MGLKTKNSSWMKDEAVLFYSLTLCRVLLSVVSEIVGCSQKRARASSSVVIFGSLIIEISMDYQLNFNDLTLISSERV